VLAVLFAPAVGMAQAVPDVDVMLVVEVQDVAGWLAFHKEVLGTPPNGARILQLTVDGAGASRVLDVMAPRFVVTLVKGSALFKVVVTGKVSPGGSLVGLSAFEYAVLENQRRPGDNVIGMFYGLSSVAADLVEMHVSRP
jgi:hypothetical protein